MTATRPSGIAQYDGVWGRNWYAYVGVPGEPGYQESGTFLFRCSAARALRRMREGVGPNGNEASDG